MTWLQDLLAGRAGVEVPLPALWVGLITLVGLYGLQCFLGVCRYYWRTRECSDKRQRKTEANRRSIEELATRVREDDNVLSQEEVARITGLSLEDLRQELRSSTITPQEALRAYQTKALEAHAKTNCLTEAIVEAEEWAAELADRPKDGPLYGVPVSIKDDVAILGYDSAMGCAKLVDVPARGHCALLKVLRTHGAVPFVRTNVPQIEASYEPGNPISGLVFNPHNVRHGPGGSSSGEAALLAAGGSVVGVGSDIGGSLRIPAHFCGVFTLKPTSTRMSHLGVWEAMPAIQTTMLPTFGPLARDVESLVAACRAFWDEEGGLADLDPRAVRLPFNDKLYKGDRKLRIGYHTDNGVFPATPACVRAVEMARQALEEEGHELLPWLPPDVEEAKNIGVRVLQSDAGRFFTETLASDEVDPSIKFLTQFYSVPRWIRRLLVTILRPLAPHLAVMVQASLGVRKTVDFFDLNRTYEIYNQRVHDAWRDQGLDALICPPFPIVAPPMPNSDLCFEGMSYSMMYNVLNYPAGVVPMTTVTSADIENLRDYPTTDWGRRAAKKAGEESGGLPVGVLVVTQRFKDELCLRVMRVLQPHSLKVKAVV